MSGQEAFGGNSYWRERARRSRWLLTALTSFVVTITLSTGLAPYALRREAAEASVVDPVRASLECGAPDQSTVTVLVPAEDIMPGTVVDASRFTRQEIPLKFAPAEILYSADGGDLTGKIAKALLPAGSLVLRREVGLGFTGPHFDIPAGYRAVGIDVDSRTSVEGWARPGAKVDLLWSIGQCADRQVYAAAERATVLALAGSTDREGRAPVRGRFTATVLVTERESKVIQLAKEGELTMVLRGDETGERGEKNLPLNIHDALRPPRADGSVDFCVVKDPATGKSTRYELGDGGWKSTGGEGSKRLETLEPGSN